MDLMANEEIEQNVLGAILVDSSLFYKILDLNEEVFYSATHQTLFRAFKSVSKEFRKIDIGLVGNYIKTFQPKGLTISYVSNLMLSIPSTSNFDEYLDILIDLYQKREIRKLFQKVDFKENSNIIKEKLLGALNNVYQQKAKDINTGEMVMNRLDSILSHEERKGLKTGFWAIDNNLKGFHGGELITIAARSQVGKTTFAVNVFTYMALYGYKPHYFSLEVPREEVLNKMLSLQSGIESKYIRFNNVPQEDEEKLVQVGSILAGKNFYIRDDRSDIEAITMKIREEVINNNLDIAFIDLINRVTTKEKAGTKAEYIGNITRRLKLLAMELNIPIVIMAQINRTVDKQVDKRPTCADLKESGSIEEDSDVIIGLYRDPRLSDANYRRDNKIEADFTSDNPDKNPERIEMIFMKSRYTGNGTIPLRYSGNINKISDVY